MRCCLVEGKVYRVGGLSAQSRVLNYGHGKGTKELSIANEYTGEKVHRAGWRSKKRTFENIKKGNHVVQ